MSKTYNLGVATAYGAAVRGGYTGTYEEWCAAMANLNNTYTHTQSQAAATWTITHNLSKYPSVTVVDSAGSVCIGDVQYVDEDTITISFQAAFAGAAYLN